MAVPKKRRSHMMIRTRRSSQVLMKTIAIRKCDKCNQMVKHLEICNHGLTKRMIKLNEL